MTEIQKALPPNLVASDRRDDRYPSQFFDLSQQYMPPTIKELFRWCTFYYYNSPLIGAAMKKVSRYPITDLIIEDPNESVKDLWENFFNKNLKIKVKLMEINLDRHVYGNCFLSLHLPTTRMLKCKKCGHNSPIKGWDWKYTGTAFFGTCKTCTHSGEVDVKDVPYKDMKKIRLVRWNPENIEIKFNEYTGNAVYYYTPPRRLRMAVQGNDKDLIEDMPLIVLKSIREDKKIKLNRENFLHLKAPTLAEQEQGWGKPVIIHVLKDMFYFYTLRRAQEAIALEHIVPFDLIYPLPSAQADPYVHMDLGDWRANIKAQIRQHRRDPNHKAIIPVPVGFGRLGGDGKALMLGPELQYITQTAVGGMGIPQEFLFGGLNWTGSSVSLRTLENDFIQNRAELLDVAEWIKDKVRAWVNYPDVQEMYFADFRMADDIQKNQQLIGLNAAGKVSDQTLLTELGYDFNDEVKRRLEEIHIQNFMQNLITQGQAKSQGEANLISMNYQDRMNEISQKGQQAAQEKLEGPVRHDYTGRIKQYVDQLLSVPPEQAELLLAQMKQQIPEVGSVVENAYRSTKKALEEMEQAAAMEQAAIEQGAQMGTATPQDQTVQAQPASTDPSAIAPVDAPLPEQNIPRRQGGV